MTTPEPDTGAPQGPAPTTGTAPTDEQPAKRRTPRWITPVIGAVAALAVGLFAGVLIGQHTAPQTQASGFTRSGTAQGGGGGFGGQGNGTGAAAGQGAFGGFTVGTITKVDGDTITVKTQSGSTVTVKTDGSTTVTTTKKSSVSALSSGDTVTVRGQTGSDDSVTATTIQEGAALNFGARPGTRRQGGTGTGTGN